MERPPTSSTFERLAGIEWMRGIAAFGVICIHSGLAVHNRTNEAASMLRSCFNFAVPFFLVLAFFFALQTELTRPSSWNRWLGRYANRLLIPFVFWSILYLGLHVAKLLVHHQTPEIKKLLEDDPAGLILSGGTSVALYFLPLLLSGLFFLRLAAPLLRRLSVLGLFAGFLAGIISQYLFSAYSQDIYFQGLSLAPLNLGLGVAGDIIRCFPLIFTAAILNRCLDAPSPQRTASFILTGLTILILMNLISLSFTFTESFKGLGAFLVAWGLSGTVALTATASLVGRYSFGVYLVHQVFLELIQVTIPFNGTVGIGGTLLITTVTFALSMIAVGIASQCESFVGRIFGLK